MAQGIVSFAITFRNGRPIILYIQLASTREVALAKLIRFWGSMTRYTLLRILPLAFYRSCLASFCPSQSSPVPNFQNPVVYPVIHGMQTSNYGKPENITENWKDNKWPSIDKQLPQGLSLLASESKGVLSRR